ncbi:hypothetical protein BT96DRAFT_284217 [Gymnopus androsaceus JB14]|uniref:Uncharacterized protein n=1 Tax=Gymnopus androsaceus JB14 TaxID=1447944 RepID=A0A6A4I624_9AGAR|nr:hypothetical protein BT96DRAFT_284217 [Gymnopus androsaceus JB14]
MYHMLQRSNHRNSSTWRAFMRWSFALGHSTPGEEHTLAINSFGEQTEHILSCEPDPKQFYWPWKQQEICCAHCHKGVASSLKVLVEHFKENPDHRVDVRKFEASYIKPEDIQEHWYWNPRVPLRALGEEFRYKLPPP